MVEKNTGSHSRICTKTPSRKWILTCHYCERIEHIRPRCFKYLVDLKKIDKKKPYCLRLTKQVWLKKSDLHCNMAYNSSKADGKIKLNNNIFHEKHEASVQKELELSSVVVSDVLGEVSEDASEKVPKDVLASTVDTLRCSRFDISTARIHTGGAGESSKNRRIPLVLVLLCLFMAKKWSIC